MEGTNEFLAKENANKNSTLISTQRDLMAGTISRDLSLRYKIPKFLVDAHNEGLIKIHDLDYFINPETNCIDENGWIYYKDEQGVKHIQLKDLKNMFDLKDKEIYKVNKKCFVLGRDGWTRLKAISVRPTNDEDNIYTFRTRSGLKLKTTGKHKIPVIRNGIEQTVLAKDIIKSDILLSSNGMTINPYEFDNKAYINLLNLEDSELKLSICNLKPLQNYIKYKYGTTLQKILNIKGNIKTISIVQFKKVLETIDIPYELFYKLKLGAKGSKTKLPLILPLNESLAKLYGYVYADGGVYINENQSTYSLTFTNTNVDLIDDFISCFEDCFDFTPSKIKPCGTSPCWRSTVGSRVIVKLFKNFTKGSFEGSSNISIPDFIMNGNRNIKLAFLSAIIDCDGYFGNGQIGYSSSSLKFIEQIVYMLNQLGYNATYNVQNNKGSKYVFKENEGYRNFTNYKILISRKEDIYNFYNELNTFKTNDYYENYKNCTSKKFIENKILDILITKEDINVYDLQTESGWFIVNDYVVHNCSLIPLDDLYENGTVINNVQITTPKSLSTAMTLATQIITQVASYQYGGCTISLSHLAPFVRVSKEKFRKTVEQEGKDNNITYTKGQIENIVNSRLKKEIKDSVQTFNYQINTMSSTNGRLAVYSGNIINY